MLPLLIRSSRFPAPGNGVLLVGAYHFLTVFHGHAESTLKVCRFCDVQTCCAESDTVGCAIEFLLSRSTLVLIEQAKKRKCKPELANRRVLIIGNEYDNVRWQKVSCK